MTTIASGEDYARHFNPDRYLERLYGNPDAECYNFVISTLHRIFTKGDIKGHLLLDIGTGPSIYNVISASSCVDEVYLSDYAEQNLKVLRSWLSEERNIQNQFVRKICELENKSNNSITSFATDVQNNSKCIEDRVVLLRRKVKKVFHIDVTDVESLKKVDVPTNYDVITSSWCMEYIVGGKEEMYKSCVKNVASLLKPGGYFVLVGDLHGLNFNMDGVTYPSVNLTKEEVCAIYKNEGFNIEQFDEMCTKNDVCAEENPDVEMVCFVMVAKKKES